VKLNLNYLRRLPVSSTKEKDSDLRHVEAPQSYYIVREDFVVLIDHLRQGDEFSSQLDAVLSSTLTSDWVESEEAGGAQVDRVH
jgi:hypothetical protein